MIWYRVLLLLLSVGLVFMDEYDGYNDMSFVENNDDIKDDTNFDTNAETNHGTNGEIHDGTNYNANNDIKDDPDGTNYNTNNNIKDDPDAYNNVGNPLGALGLNSTDAASLLNPMSIVLPTCSDGYTWDYNLHRCRPLVS